MAEFALQILIHYFLLGLAFSIATLFFYAEKRIKGIQGPSQLRALVMLVPFCTIAYPYLLYGLIKRHLQKGTIK